MKVGQPCSNLSGWELHVLNCCSEGHMPHRPQQHKPWDPQAACHMGTPHTQPSPPLLWKCLGPNPQLPGCSPHPPSNPQPRANPGSTGCTMLPCPLEQGQEVEAQQGRGSLETVAIAAGWNLRGCKLTQGSHVAPGIQLDILLLQVTITPLIQFIQIPDRMTRIAFLSLSIKDSCKIVVTTPDAFALLHIIKLTNASHICICSENKKKNTVKSYLEI